MILGLRFLGYGGAPVTATPRLGWEICSETRTLFVCHALAGEIVTCQHRTSGDPTLESFRTLAALSQTSTYPPA